MSPLSNVDKQRLLKIQEPLVTEEVTIGDEPASRLPNGAFTTLLVRHFQSEGEEARNEVLAI